MATVEARVTHMMCLPAVMCVKWSNKNDFKKRIIGLTALALELMRASLLGTSWN